MKIAMITEDNKGSKLGKLLSSSYNSCNIYFSESNTRLRKKISQVYNSYDLILVFFDLVPNNKDLAVQLAVLSRALLRLDIENKVHIFPVICAEYVYLRALCDYARVDVLDMEIESTLGYSKSAEKYYKKIFEDYESTVGMHIDNEDEYFYVCFPIFDIVSEEHESLLIRLGVEFKETSIKEVGDFVTSFYIWFYSLYSKSFEDEMAGRNIILF